MKKLYLLCCALSLLAGCQTAKVCDYNMASSISFKGFKAKPGDKARLASLNSNGTVKKSFLFNGMRFDEAENHTFMSFELNPFSGKETYKLTYNNQVFFIYNFKVSAKKKMPLECGIQEPSFRLNDCAFRASLDNLDKSCGIPTSEADAYFKKYVQPTMK